MSKDKMVEKLEHQSKIVSLQVENFMSIKSALVEFDDSNIISLCGYNDSGKSAITRLLEVMFYDTYNLDQVKFITDGEDYWQGVLTFSDGVKYTRVKYSDGKSLYELSKGAQILFTNRLENGTFAAMGEIPEIIQNYLGVIQEESTREELNVRRNTDRLFLINTTGGDNYKILNSVLRSDVLSEASRRLNDDKNKLNSEVTSLKTTKEVFEEQLSESDAVPVEIIDDLKSFISSLTVLSERLSGLSVIGQNLLDMSHIHVSDELKPVALEQLQSLKNIMGLCEVCNTPIYQEVKSVDLDRVLALQNIMDLSVKNIALVGEELEGIDVDKLRSIKETAQLYNVLAGVQGTFSATEEALSSTRAELTKLSVENDLKICKNCGAIVA